MAIKIHDGVPSPDGANDFAQSFASVIAASQTSVVSGAVSGVDAQYRRMIEPLLPVLDALSATWTPSAISLPPQYFHASAPVQADLTAPLVSPQTAVTAMTGPSFATPPLSVITGMLETLRVVTDTVVPLSIDYGITVPDMSWLADSVLPTIDYGITVPDMSWLADSVLPTIDYGITVPDMSWLADSVLPTIDYGITVPDMSWLADSVLPTIDYGITVPDMSWLPDSVLPTIDYGITVPDMSWLADSVGLTMQPGFSVPDISWLPNAAAPSDSAGTAPHRERAPIDPDAVVDNWLSSIRPDLPSKRAGMWWALRHSPDGVCHAATSAVELFDHVLHELAPDLMVVAVSQDHSDPELFVRDTRFGPQPTWSGRARVAVMVLGGDATAQTFAASFVAVRNQLVNMKHKSHLHGLQGAEIALDRLDLLLRQLAAYR
jgi:hypothetical protein